MSTKTIRCWQKSIIGMPCAIGLTISCLAGTIDVVWGAVACVWRCLREVGHDLGGRWPIPTVATGMTPNF